MSGTLWQHELTNCKTTYGNNLVYGSSRKYKALILVMDSGSGDANSSELLKGDIIRLKSEIPKFLIIHGIGAL